MSNIQTLTKGKNEEINRLLSEYKIDSPQNLIKALHFNKEFSAKWNAICRKIASEVICEKSTSESGGSKIPPEDIHLNFYDISDNLKSTLVSNTFPNVSNSSFLLSSLFLEIYYKLIIAINNIRTSVKNFATCLLLSRFGLKGSFIDFINKQGQIDPCANISSHDKFSFEEYAMYFESAERVTDRRIEMNRYNYSVCTAILIALTLLLQWALKNTDYILFSLPFTVFLSLIAIFYCTLWIGQLLSFKNLNSVKFEILNKMAQNIYFSPSSFDNRISYCPFEREWKILENNKKALEPLRIKPDINALKSSNAEFAIPYAFITLFTLIIVIGSVFLTLYAKGMVAV